MKLKALTVIDDGKNPIQPGTTFERPKKEALQLIDWGAVEEVVKVVEPDPDPDPDPEEIRDPLTGLPTS